MKILFEKLKQAKKPLILAGHGVRCANQVAEFREMIGKLQIPVVTTQLARDLIPYHHPLYIGSPGIKGDRAGGLAVQNCDFLLILGCSLHPSTTGYEVQKFAPKSFKIHVDLDGLVHAKVSRTDFIQHKIVMGVSDFIKGLSGLEMKYEFDWRVQLKHWKSRFDMTGEPGRNTDSYGIDYYDVIDVLNEITEGNETIIADAGSAFYITGQAWRKKGTQRVILPGGLAQMGYTTGAMIGACFADPDHRVIGLTGDGSVHTNIHDLAVFNEHNLNAKLIVFNNLGYACIRNTQDSYFKGFYSGVDSTTGVSFPNYEMLSEAYRIDYFDCARKEDLKGTLKKVLGSVGPVFCEIFSNRDQQIIPRVQSQTAPDGTMVSTGLDEMFPYRE